MTLRQGEIDFTVEYNRHPGNQEILDANRLHFSRQAKWVFEQLMAGRTIDGRIAYQEYDILDLRARIFSIKKVLKPLNIEPQFHLLSNRLKLWYFTPEQIKEITHNKKLLEDGNRK